jgi:hypothetical protein
VHAASATVALAVLVGGIAFFVGLTPAIYWSYGELQGDQECHRAQASNDTIVQLPKFAEDALSGSSLWVRLGSVLIPLAKALLAALSGFGGLVALRAIFDPRGAVVADGAAKRTVADEAALRHDNLRRAHSLPDADEDDNNDEHDDQGADPESGAVTEREPEPEPEPDGASPRTSEEEVQLPCPCARCQSHIHYIYNVICDASGTDPIKGNLWQGVGKADLNLCDEEYLKLSAAERRGFVLKDKPQHIEPEKLSTWAAIMAKGENQATWEQARAALHLNAKQARWVSRAKLVLWHWSQPVAYLLICSLYFCSLADDQRALAAIVAARELLYWLLTVAAYAKLCPAFILLELGSVWRAEKFSAADIRQRGEALVGRHVLTGDGRSGRISSVGPNASEATPMSYRVTYSADGLEEEDVPITEAEALSTIVRWRLDTTELFHWVVYIFAPHYYVTLCVGSRIAGDSGWAKLGKRALLLVGLFEFGADCCGAWALYLLLQEDNAPLAMALGYWLTVCGFVVGTGSALALQVTVSGRVRDALINVPMFGAPVLFGVYVLVAAPLQLAFGVHMAWW